MRGQRLGVWVLGVSLALPAGAAAQDAVDRHVWVQVLATVRLSENWRLHLEEQPRWFNDGTDAFQVISRGALGRRVGARASVWGGYAWVAKPPGPGVTHEHRIWQQLSATFPAAKRWTPSMRLRLEQRLQDTWSDTSHRLRVMGRAVRPLDPSGRWSVAAWNELFVTVDDTAIGPWRGIDQNRLFAGALRQFSPRVGLEVGYLWVTSEPPSRPRTHAHTAFAWLNLTL